jgi:hypothetical protein
MVLQDHAKQISVKPVYIALAIAMIGIIGMLLVDHGPWTRPQVQTADVAVYHTTGEAARAAGARVTPTRSNLSVEPQPQVPKQAEPPNPQNK